MIKWEIFFKNREILEFSFICENTPYLKKIFESMAAKSGSLPLQVGEFTCMLSDR
jgi:hypothetical protein